jgi:hypothetical protein
MRYCLNCKQNVEPENKRGLGRLSVGLIIVFLITWFISESAWISLLVTFFMGLIGWAYNEERCPICKSKNFSLDGKTNP